MDGTEVSTYSYFDGVVTGSPELNEIEMTEEEFLHNLETLNGWESDVRLGSLFKEQRPSDQGLTAAVTDEISVISGVVLWEIETGDLTFTIEFNAGTYTLTRTEFQISWANFKYFLRGFNRFSDTVSKLQ